MLNSSEHDVDDVNIILDGDDWLSSTNILSRLNEVYSEDNCLLTYGSYVAFPSGIIGVEPSQYPDSVVQNNSFREDSWRASHLKSFKYS